MAANMQQLPGQTIPVQVDGYDRSSNQPVMNGRHSQQRKMKVLNAAEALKFSPLTTSPATGLDRIPLPEVGSAHHTSSLISEEERDRIFKTLESLKDARYRPGGVEEYARVAREVQQRLSADDLPDFKLKPRHHITRSAGRAATAAAHASELSPFSKMILENIEVPFRYPSPSTPSPRVKPTVAAFQAPAQVSRLTPNDEIVDRNVRLHSKIETPKASVTPASQRLEPVVIVQSLLPSQKAKYIALPDSPKRRKVEHEGWLEAQKQNGAAVAEKLEQLLQEVFEEEDRCQPDTSMGTFQQGNLYFDLTITDEGGLPLLSVKTHSKLQNALEKVIEVDHLQEIPLDYLRRLVRLCEDPISAIEDIDVRVKADLEHDQLMYWQSQLRRAECSISAASTLMTIVIGNLREKELFPEEMSSKLPLFLHKIIEDLIIPVVELRSTGKSAASFAIAKSAKDTLVRLVSQSRKFLELFANLHMKMKDTEFAINAIVALGPQLISVEQVSNERDSVLGSQTFEVLRKAAMSVLGRVFAMYREQQLSITEGLLDSLSKLPTAKQGARQYRASDGKAIQLVSALFMQLVQATATTPQLDGTGFRTSLLSKSTAVPAGDHELLEDEGVSADTSLEQLEAISHPLSSCAHMNAMRIIRGFLKRAIESKKLGDEKHRNLLDLFIEDLVAVVGLPEWPAAQTLLQMLTSDLCYSITNKLEIDGEILPLQPNTALEILGWVAIAILKLKEHLAKSIEQVSEGHRISQNISQLAHDQQSSYLRPEDLIGSTGPFRLVIEYLDTHASENWHIFSAKSLYVLQWADLLCNTYGRDNNSDPEVNELAATLERILFEPRYVKADRYFVDISAAEARIAYHLIVLNSQFCKYFDPIIRILVNSINSEQIKTRSRSLKSIVSLLEVDPKLLDKEPGIMKAIFRCTTDASAMVRDSALSLIGRYISITPTLLAEGCQTILKRFNDASVGVRKKCINLSREIYQKEQRQEIRVAISNKLLQKIQDHEDSISGLARQILEDLWFSELMQVLATTEVDERARTQVAVSKQTEIIVDTLGQQSENAALLENFVRTLFKDRSKTAPLLEKSFKAIVSDAFDKAVTLDNVIVPKNTEFLLKALTVFGKAHPALIDSGRLATLLPYLSNLSSTKSDERDRGDELAMFRSVVSIFHSVVPHISALDKPLLAQVRASLFNVIGRLTNPVLDEVTACLWAIYGVLKETPRYFKFATSVYKNGIGTRGNDLSDPQIMTRLRSYVRILGSVVKNWDLEFLFPEFKKFAPTTNESSVAGLAVDFLVPFTMPGQPLQLRATALQSLASVCQSWPGQFGKDLVQQALLDVFSSSERELQEIVLQGFAGFFGIREHTIDTFASKSGNDDMQDQELGRLGGSLKASEHDAAAAIIGAQFLKPMLKVATTRVDRSALIATQVIASINRQGILHPKECTGALVALGTSTNQEIAKIAVETHRLLHQQHETMFEREYMRAVLETFIYQKDVIGDPLGSSVRPYLPKLRSLFDIVKTSNSKYVKKFLSNLITKSSAFDLAKVDSRGNPPQAVLFTQFIMQNLAFFEYGKLEDVIHILGHMEGVVGKIGVDVAQSIEVQILRSGMSLEGSRQAPSDAIIENGGFQGLTQTTSTHDQPIDLQKLRQLTTAAIILSIVYETRAHLRRQYGVTRAHFAMAKTKDAKELSKAPSKAHGVTGERYWESLKGLMASMESENSMKARCQAFVTLMNVDEEVKVNADDGARLSLSESMDRDDSPSQPNTPSGRKGARGKRKSSMSAGGTPKKKRGRPRRSSVAHSDDSDGDWD